MEVMGKKLNYMGRYSEPRNAQKTDLPQHPLLEDASNLGLFLND
jgi:hypothetical protein